MRINDGTPLYQAERVEGVSYTYASPVAADGHIYMTDRNGTITVIRDGDAPVIIAVNDMKETVDATPAPVGKELFIRGENTLFCLAND